MFLSSLLKVVFYYRVNLQSNPVVLVIKIKETEPLKTQEITVFHFVNSAAALSGKKTLNIGYYVKCNSTDKRFGRKGGGGVLKTICSCLSAQSFSPLGSSNSRGQDILSSGNMFKYFTAVWQSRVVFFFIF